MIDNHVIVIMPKESSYVNRSEESKIMMKRRIYDVLKDYEALGGMRFFYFAEDVLARELLNGREYTFALSCFTNVDRIIASRLNVFGGSDYLNLGVTELYKDDIAEAKRIAGVSNKDSSKKSDARNMFYDIRRAAVNLVLEQDSYDILYFDKNNQYCNLKEPKLGDLRLIHHVDLNTDIESFWYSGQDIDKELYFRIIKEGLSIK